MPPADFVARAKFSAYAETHMGVIISYRSFAPLIRDNLVAVCAGAGRRNGDYYLFCKKSLPKTPKWFIIKL